VKVLVAEDDPVSRRVVAVMLARWGYGVRLAADGLEAWAALQEPDAPSLVVVDWMMPGLDGPELCRRIRSSRERGARYVVLLTARGGADDVIAGLEAGADDYVRKPFEPGELRARLRVGERMVALQHRLSEQVRHLAEREARLRAIFEGAHDAIITTGSDGLVRDVNPSSERIFGRAAAETIGRPLCPLLVSERHAMRLAAAVSAPGTQILQLTGVRPDGTEFPIELWVAAVRHGEDQLYTSFVRDVSERQRLEVELAQAQKLESVGRLAAGVAHEINTPIQFVGDNTRFIADGFAGVREVLTRYRALCTAAERAGFEPALVEDVRRAEESADLPYLEDETPRALAQTLDGVERVAAIVRALKQFAHPDGGQEKTATDINEALRSTLIVARNELKYVADVEVEFGDLPPVVCQIGELNQVFLNLLVNAAHAIADVVRDTGKKGRIGVGTACEGDDVVITISDTGCGIPEAIRSKIFDPFFTTKEVGRGTGQGLAIARTIVADKHGGSLTFQSEVGRGTTFSIRLPVDACCERREAAAG
jgi:PAS domain S-box-containing protein